MWLLKKSWFATPETKCSKRSPTNGFTEKTRCARSPCWFVVTPAAGVGGNAVPSAAGTSFGSQNSLFAVSDSHLGQRVPRSRNLLSLVRRQDASLAFLPVGRCGAAYRAGVSSEAVYGARVRRSARLCLSNARLQRRSQRVLANSPTRRGGHRVGDSRFVQFVFPRAGRESEGRTNARYSHRLRPRRSESRVSG